MSNSAGSMVEPKQAADAWRALDAGATVKLVSPQCTRIRARSPRLRKTDMARFAFSKALLTRRHGYALC